MAGPAGAVEWRAGAGGRSGGRVTAVREFAAAPVRARLWVGVAVLLALALPLLLTAWPSPPVAPVTARDLLTAAALVGGSVLSVEIGRLFEGGTVAQQRPHKALSAWPMAAAVLLPAVYLIPVVVLIYAHARWRGMRVTLWKWCASACFLICAGAVAGLVLTVPTGAPPTLESGAPGLLIMVAAVLAFLSVEAFMLAVAGWLNTAEDEVWLRRTLADPAFYLTEAGVITIGALTGLLGAQAPWFVLLLVPAYGFLQQSVLHRPLQERATRDPKTGLLVFTAWQQLAAEEIRRMSAHRRSWAVIFADIDHFRLYNEHHGHLGGDRALEQVARIITGHVRPRDLIARFGGEEFCVLLPDTLAADAGEVAHRLRRAVAEESTSLPEPVTVSIGVAVVESGHTPMELAVVLARADQALYRAKLDGRNTVRIAGPATDADRSAHSQN